MLNYLTAAVMLMNLKRLFRCGELLPSNSTCRIGVLRDETKDMCISSLGENKIMFKSILQYFNHSRNQVCLATEIGLVIVVFYCRGVQRFLKFQIKQADQAFNFLLV